MNVKHVRIKNTDLYSVINGNRMNLDVSDVIRLVMQNYEYNNGVFKIT